MAGLRPPLVAAVVAALVVPVVAETPTVILQETKWAELAALEPHRH